MRHSRRGLTLIEVLVVIGIILVLVGLLVAGFRHLNRTAANKETLAELHVCRGLLQEYENKAGLAGIEAAAAQTTDPNAPLPGKFPVFQDPADTVTPATATSVYGSSGSATPGTVWSCYEAPGQSPNGSNDLVVTVTGPPPYSGDMGGKSPPTARYGSQAVLQTYDVMYALMRIPANQTTVQSIQSKRLLEPPPSSSGPTTPYPITHGVLLLDGWGNPIIFVPRGGIHVFIKNQTTGQNDIWLVRSTGTTNVTANSGNDPPMTGSERPFWASAGQDGDFTLGEDNIYSFQD